MSSRTLGIKADTKERVNALKRKLSFVKDKDYDYDEFLNEVLDVFEASTKLDYDNEDGDSLATETPKKRSSSKKKSTNKLDDEKKNNKLDDFVKKPIEEVTH